MKINANLNPTIAISQDTTRVSLSSAYLDAEVSVLVSCDGHRMTVMPVTLDDGDASGRVSTAALEAAQAAGKAAIKAIKLPPEKQYAKRLDAVLARRNYMVDVSQWADTGPDAAAPFAPWKQVLPAFRKSHTVGLNARYLLELARALGATNDVVYLELETAGRDPELQAIRVTGLDSTVGAYAILMPAAK